MSKITSPEEFFGFVPGSDYKMIRWDKLCEYYRLLEKETGRIKVTSPGKTSEGNEFLILYISSEKNIKNLEHYREISLKLAKPGNLSDKEIASLAKEGKSVCMQSYSLHSNEVGGAQCVPLVLYDILSAQKGDKLYDVLENTIFIVSPCSEPDGEIIFTDWYYKHLGTRFEGICSPYLRHNYAGHSNNRDALREAVIESKYLNDILVRTWRPQIFQDYHHEYPWEERMNIAPDANPIYPCCSPIVYRESSVLGTEMAQALTLAGRKGVVSAGDNYDFYPMTTFYSMAKMHNIIGMLSENADTRIASPIFLHPEQIKGTRFPTMQCPDPWEGGEWHLYDIVDQMKIASEALLLSASNRREEFLLNMANKAKQQTERGRKDPENTYFLPEAQNDPSALHLLLKLMQEQGISIFKTKKDMTVGSSFYPAGTYAVPLGQPDYAVVKIFLARMPYPQNKYNARPDGTTKVTDTANTCVALCMGVDAFPANCVIDEKLLIPYSEGEYSIGKMPLPSNQNASYHEANLLLSSGTKLYRTQNGDFSDKKTKGSTSLCPAKILLMKMSMTGNEEEGYTRNLLRRYDFDYDIILDREIREKGIPENADILIIPGDAPERLSAGDIAPDLPPEYHIGFGTNGKNNLIDFVNRGGRLIAWEASINYVNEVFGLGLADRSRGLSQSEYATNWSQFRAQLCEEGKKTFFGMPEFFTLQHKNAPIPEPTDLDHKIDILARFVKENVFVNGYAVGEKHLCGTPCILKAKYGKGEIYLFTFNPEFRIQQDGTFKLLFNILYK